MNHGNIFGREYKKLLLRTFLFLLYLVLGAGIFLVIEAPHESEERRNLDFANVRDNFTQKYNVDEDEMIKFLNSFNEAFKYGYIIEENTLETEKWTFVNAFFFAGNVITTIGYGHIVPLTVAGRLVCILYALFGIPLTGLTLRSVGNRITEWITTGLKIYDRRIHNRETEKVELKVAVVAFCFLWIAILVPAIGFSTLENWEYVEGVYFCFITLTTIGFGDFVTGHYGNKRSDGLQVVLELSNLLYFVLGLALMSGIIVSISSYMEEKTKALIDPMDALRNIRVENLNSVALKKLGYKMPRGAGPDNDNIRRVPPRKHRTMSVSMLPGAPPPTDNNTSSKLIIGPTPIMSIEREKPAEVVRPKTPDQAEEALLQPGSRQSSSGELVVKAEISPMPSPRTSPPPSYEVTNTAPIDKSNSESPNKPSRRRPFSSKHNKVAPLSRMDSSLQKKDLLTGTDSTEETNTAFNSTESVELAVMPEQGTKDEYSRIEGMVNSSFELENYDVNNISQTAKRKQQVTVEMEKEPTQDSLISSLAGDIESPNDGLDTNVNIDEEMNEFKEATPRANGHVTINISEGALLGATSEHLTPVKSVQFSNSPSDDKSSSAGFDKMSATVIIEEEDEEEDEELVVGVINSDSEKSTDELYDDKITVLRR